MALIGAFAAGDGSGSGNPVHPRANRAQRSSPARTDPGQSQPEAGVRAVAAARLRSRPECSTGARPRQSPNASGDRSRDHTTG